MTVYSLPEWTQERDALLLGRERLPLAAVSSVELQVRPPNLRLALVAALSGGVAVPALSMLTAAHGTTPLMVGGLGAAALAVFGGCYQLVSGAERYQLTLHLSSGSRRVSSSHDRDRAHALLAELERLGKAPRATVSQPSANPEAA